MYYNGDGVEQSYVRAYAWFRLAASSGDSTARDSRREAHEKMSLAELDAAQTLAKDFFNRYRSESNPSP